MPCITEPPGVDSIKVCTVQEIRNVVARRYIEDRRGDTGITVRSSRLLPVLHPVWEPLPRVTGSIASRMGGSSSLELFRNNSAIDVNGKRGKRIHTYISLVPPEIRAAALAVQNASRASRTLVDPPETLPVFCNA